MKRTSKKKKATRAEKLAALKMESELALIDTIRRLQAKPMNQRTHFLRKKISYAGSCL